MPIGQYGNTVSGARSAGIGQIKLERLGDSLNPLAERLNKLENVALKKKEVQEARAYDDSVRQQQNQFQIDRDETQHGYKVEDMNTQFDLNEQSADNQVGRTMITDDHRLENDIKRDNNTFGNQKEMASINHGYSLDLLKKKESSAKRVAKYKDGLNKVDPALANSLSGVLDNMYVYSDKGYTKDDKANDIVKEKERLKSEYDNTVSSTISKLTKAGMPESEATKYVSLFDGVARKDKASLKEFSSLAKSGKLNDLGIADIASDFSYKRAVSNPKSKEFKDAIKKYSSSLPEYRDPVVDLPATQKNIATKKETLLRAGSQAKGSSAKYIDLLSGELDKNLDGVTKYLNASDKKVKDAETEAVNNVKATKDSQLKDNVIAYNMELSRRMKESWSGKVSDTEKKEIASTFNIKKDSKTKMFVPL